MAIFHPRVVADDVNQPELFVRHALESLDDQWHIFHGYQWTNQHGHGYETDFALLHPQMGLIVLEVKGGRIRISDGQFEQLRHGTWIAVYPIRQGDDGMHHLGRKLKDLGTPVPYRLALVFPSERTAREFVAPGLPPGAVWCRPELDHLEAAIDRVIASQHAPDRHLSGRDVASIVHALAPSSRPTADEQFVDERQAGAAESAVADLTAQFAALMSEVGDRLDRLERGQIPDVLANVDALRTSLDGLRLQAGGDASNERLLAALTGLERRLDTIEGATKRTTLDERETTQFAALMSEVGDRLDRLERGQIPDVLANVDALRTSLDGLRLQAGGDASNERLLAALTGLERRLDTIEGATKRTTLDEREATEMPPPAPVVSPRPQPRSPKWTRARHAVVGILIATIAAAIAASLWAKEHQDDSQGRTSTQAAPTTSPTSPPRVGSTTTAPVTTTLPSTTTPSLLSTALAAPVTSSTTPTTTAPRTTVQPTSTTSVDAAFAQLASLSATPNSIDRPMPECLPTTTAFDVTVVIESNTVVQSVHVWMYRASLSLLETSAELADTGDNRVFRGPVSADYTPAGADVYFVVQITWSGGYRQWQTGANWHINAC